MSIANTLTHSHKLTRACTSTHPHTPTPTRFGEGGEGGGDSTRRRVQKARRPLTGKTTSRAYTLCVCNSSCCVSQGWALLGARFNARARVEQGMHDVCMPAKPYLNYKPILCSSGSLFPDSEWEKEKKKDFLNFFNRFFFFLVELSGI